MKPPFRADQVGSLLRPAELAEARSKFKKGEIDAAARKAAEDKAIRDVIAKQEAIVRAATTRLRPVLMTSLTAVFGATPLVLASGAGYESRQAVGIVIVFGVTVATLLTLFVVPAMYALLARGTQTPEHVEKEIEALRASR